MMLNQRASSRIGLASHGHRGLDALAWAREPTSGDVSRPQLHQDLEHISFLVGTWRGEGKGDYPTIDPFAYEEEIRFWHDGRPLLFYEQRNWNSESKAPMHSESGFWRPREDRAIEVVLAHGFGVAEIEEGQFRGRRFELRSKSLASTSTAKVIREVTRTYEVDGDVLTYQMAMAYGDTPLNHHLRAELRRV
jgi:THAP domain-containing protein 4